MLRAAGAEVASEFYINDRGAQMQRFGASLAAVAAGEPVPADGYHGDYIPELAADIVARHPEVAELTGEERVDAFRDYGYALQLEEQRQTLEDFHTHFDVWFSERSLYESGAVDRGLAKLEEQGHIFDRRRRAVAAHHRLRRRQGPRAGALQR